MEQTMLIAVLIAALVGLFLFDTVRLRRMQVQRDAAKEEVAEVKTEFLSAASVTEDQDTDERDRGGNGVRT